MYDEQTIQNIRNAIRTICRTAVMTDAVEGEYGSDLAEALEKTAEAIQREFGLDNSVMEDYRAAAEKSKDMKFGEMEEVTPREAEYAQEMVYAMCDKIDDPKEIMRHVRAATEMMRVWSNGE